MEQSIWTYRDPAPTKILDTKGIMSLIADYLKGPAERPLMIWCHNNPSIDRLYQYLHNYKREDGAMLFTISCPVTVRMLGHDVASVYVSEEIDDEDHLEEVKREEEWDVEPCDGGDELPF